MRFGSIIGIATDRDDDQRKSIASIRQFSRPDTQIIAVFNGVKPFALPEDVETFHVSQTPIGREQGTWKVLLDLATSRNWDWACDFHDDMFLFESGWENFVEEEFSRYPLAIAAFYNWGFLRYHDTSPGTGSPNFSMQSGNPDGWNPKWRLGVSPDGCGIAFNTQLFAKRGFITNIQASVGYGEVEAGLWAYEQGWFCAKIHKNAAHHPGLTSNTRSVLKNAAEGQHEAIQQHLGSLPAQVIGPDEVQLKDRIVKAKWKPGMQKPIPVLRPTYDHEEEEAVVRVIRSGWTGSGPEVAAFEKEFGDFLGVEPEQVVATNSCTAALQLALIGADLRVGSAVAVTPLTFASTVNVIRHVGCEPVFIDIEPDRLCIDTDKLKGLWPGISAVIGVHFGGETFIPTTIDSRMTVIEDCAHAAGSMLPGKLTSQFKCFSFQAVKNIGAGDGGAVVCRDVEVAKRLRRLRWCGIDKSTFDRSSDRQYAWEYDVTEPGFKYQMSELNAAVARVQLKKLPEHNERRRNVAYRYLNELAGLDWLALPKAFVVRSSNHLFVVRLPDADVRARLMAYLADRDIHTSVHYKPINHYKLYADRPGPTPISDQVSQQILSLPMHASLSEQDVDRIIRSIRAFKP